MGIVQTVPRPSFRYPVAGQEYGPASFFLFSSRPRLSFSRLSKGRKPRLSLRSRDNSVREPNAQPAPATGLFKGFGVLPQQAKTGFRRSRRKPVLSLCGNKDTACKVAHLHKYLKQFGTENQCLEYLTAQRWKERHGAGRTAILGALTLPSAIRGWRQLVGGIQRKLLPGPYMSGCGPYSICCPVTTYHSGRGYFGRGKTFLYYKYLASQSHHSTPNSCLLTGNN